MYVADVKTRRVEEQKTPAHTRQQRQLLAPPPLAALQHGVYGGPPPERGGDEPDPRLRDRAQIGANVCVLRIKIMMILLYEAHARVNRRAMRRVGSEGDGAPHGGSARIGPYPRIFLASGQ